MSRHTSPRRRGRPSASGRQASVESVTMRRVLILGATSSSRARSRSCTRGAATGCTWWAATPRSSRGRARLQRRVASCARQRERRRLRAADDNEAVIAGGDRGALRRGRHGAHRDRRAGRSALVRAVRRRGRAHAARELHQRGVALDPAREPHGARRIGAHRGDHLRGGRPRQTPRTTRTGRRRARSTCTCRGGRLAA